MYRQFKYYIGSGDPYGEDSPNEVFNDVYAERLKKLGIKEKDMKEVAKMFEDIYEIGYRNGYSNCDFDVQDAEIQENWI